MSVREQSHAAEEKPVYFTYPLRMTPEQHAELTRKAERQNTTLRALILSAALDDPHLDVPTRMGRPPRTRQHVQEALPESA